MSEPSLPERRPGALDGIRVLELSAIIAGPSCARWLADHGAEVIKIERYPDGDVGRMSGRGRRGRSPLFVQHNGGKKGMCVDLSRPEGGAIVRDLVRQSDVVIEAYTPGVMKRLGLGWDELRRIRPDLVMCSISGFGQTGPNASRPGYAHVAHSMAGWLAVQFLHRDPPEAPRGPGVAVADVVTGLVAFGAICAALVRRERTGEGEYVDLALFDSLFATNDASIQQWLLTGETSVTYHPVHATRDGWVTANIGPDFRAWQGVCAAMGRLDLLEDPRFSDQRSVLENVQAATGLVKEWLAGLDTVEAERRLREQHVVVGVVKSLPEAVRQPQVEARGLLETVDDPVFGRVEVVNSPIRYAHGEARVRGPAPRLGEHNSTVLRDLLGYPDDRIEELRSAGVLRDGPL